MDDWSASAYNLPTSLFSSVDTPATGWLIPLLYSFIVRGLRAPMVVQYVQESFQVCWHFAGHPFTTANLNGGWWCLFCFNQGVKSGARYSLTFEGYHIFHSFSYFQSDFGIVW